MEEVVPLLEEMALRVPEEFAPHVPNVVPLLLDSLKYPEYVLSRVLCAFNELDCSCALHS